MIDFDTLTVLLNNNIQKAMAFKTGNNTFVIDIIRKDGTRKQGEYCTSVKYNTHSVAEYLLH